MNDYGWNAIILPMKEVQELGYYLVSHLVLVLLENLVLEVWEFCSHLKIYFAGMKIINS